MYGADTWYAGRQKPSPPLTGHRRSQLGRRLPYRGTRQSDKGGDQGSPPSLEDHPISVLHREAGVPTAEIALEHTRHRLSLRTKTVDESHPFVKRLPNSVSRAGRPISTTAWTRLQRTAALLPDFPRPKLTALRYAPGSREASNAITKKETAKEFVEWLETVPDEETVVYTDGSKTDKGTGYGYTIYRGLENVARGSDKLGLPCLRSIGADSRTELLGSVLRCNQVEIYVRHSLDARVPPLPPFVSCSLLTSIFQSLVVYIGTCKKREREASTTWTI